MKLCMGAIRRIVAAHKHHGAHGRGEFQADGADGARCEAHGVMIARPDRTLPPALATNMVMGRLGSVASSRRICWHRSWAIGVSMFPMTESSRRASILIINAGERDTSGGFTHGEGLMMGE